MKPDDAHSTFDPADEPFADMRQAYAPLASSFASSNSSAILSLSPRIYLKLFSVVRRAFSLCDPPRRCVGASRRADRHISVP